LINIGKIGLEKRKLWRFFLGLALTMQEGLLVVLAAAVTVTPAAAAAVVVAHGKLVVNPSEKHKRLCFPSKTRPQSSKVAVQEGVNCSF